MKKPVTLIVGLGNPGPKYAHTRHNAGFDTIEKLEKRLGATARKRMMFPGMLAEADDGERTLVLCKPLTLMNRSGICVKKLLAKYRTDEAHLIVICDDIDLKPGAVRVRKSGGAGTHNGMRSILQELGNGDFARIRVGTGDRPAGEDLVAWVLGRCEGAEREKMDAAFEAAADAAIAFAREGIDRAIQTGNRKG